MLHVPSFDNLFMMTQLKAITGWKAITQNVFSQLYFIHGMLSNGVGCVSWGKVSAEEWGSSTSRK